MSRIDLRITLLLAVLTLTICAAGCGSKPQSDRPATYPVSGTVTMNGEPVTDANVNFQLTDGSRGASGLTDQQGTFSLTTFVAGDGALPGEYRVAITKFEKPPQGAQVPEDHPDYNPNVPSFVPRNLLPEKYANPQTSELTATVTEGANTVKFELTD
jgi:hypothetical protein